MDNLINKIQKEWVIIVFLAGVVMWYANVNSRLTVIETAQADQITTNQKIDQLVTDTALIKQDVSYIKDKIK